MAKNNDSWGIEVGANAIKAIHLTRAGSKGPVRMVAHEVLAFKRVLTTPDLNIAETIQVNLDQLMARHDMSKSTVTISVPGHMAFARFAKLPPVEPKKIPDIVTFEAVQQIPFPIDQVEWDYQVFQQEDAPDVEVGIFAITKEKVMSYLSNYNAVHLHVDALTLSPLAVFNAFVYDTAEEPEQEGVIYIDIGTSATDVIIVENGGIWLRTLPLGGDTFTEALVKAFKLSHKKAEKLKREAATSKYARQIFQAMRPVFADLVQEMQRSLGYYQSLNRDANLTKVVGVGSTFKLPGLQKFLKQQLQMEVVRPDGFKRIEVDDKQASEFADQAPNLATAYGLALQGLGLETVSANILPSHIIRQRMWKAKQPWIGAAAACFVVAAGICVGRMFKDAGTIRDGLEAARSQFARVESTARDFKQRFDQIDTASNPRQRIENLSGILGSRDLWPKLLEDITQASLALGPQPQTLTNDYEQTGKIPRAERRRIYIESITTSYDAGGEDIDDAENEQDMLGPSGGYPGAAGGYPGAAGGAGGYPGMEGSYDSYADYGGGYGGGTQGDLGKTYSMSDFFDEGKTAPSFTVTVKGTTPMTDGARFVEDNFVGWLKKHAEVPGRPYRFIIDEGVLVDYGKVVVAATDTRAGDTAGGRFGGASAYRARPGAQNPYGGYGASAYGGGGRGTGSVTDLASLLPSRPLADEDISGDHFFELRWTVELIDPTAPLKPADSDQSQDAQEGPTAKLHENDRDERGES